MFERARTRPQRDSDAPNRTARRLLILVAGIVLDGLRVWLRTGRPGGWVVVRCRAGHLFSTIWVPGISLKALRFGLWRFQRCPVGHHWALVTPVKEAELSGNQLELARATRDISIP